MSDFCTKHFRCRLGDGHRGGCELAPPTPEVRAQIEADNRTLGWDSTSRNCPANPAGVHSAVERLNGEETCACGCTRPVTS